MSGASKTRDFFQNGSSGQFEWVLGLYDEALRMKAESKSSKPENVIKLDKWYQTELPKKIKSRGKEAHLLHDELVQTIKWKLARGKFQANMVNLIQMNTPRVVMTETKKAFRNIFKRGSIESAAQALCNLKGVGPTMASAVLAAGAPHLAPFMADECLLAMPDGENLDYTMKEYMRFVEYVQGCVERLKVQGGEWDPHKVELAVWTHAIIHELKPELLVDMPGATAMASTPAPTPTPVTSSATSNGGASSEANGEDSNSASSEKSESANGDDVKNGDNDFSSDENDVQNVAQSNDRVSSPEETTVSEIHLPASNGNDNSVHVDATTVHNDDATIVHNNDAKVHNDSAVHTDDIVHTVETVHNDATMHCVETVRNDETVHTVETMHTETTVHENGKKEILNEQEVSQEASIIQPEESEKRELESSEEVESLEPATKKFKPDDQPEAVATAVV